MNRLLQILALAVFAAIAPLRASAGSEFLEERYKAALNDMVQEVRNTPGPAAKREVLQHFIDHMSQGMQKAQGMESITEPDRQTLKSMIGKFYAYDAELNGQAEYGKVPDGQLDQFAGFMRQGMEQAPVGGGIYISAGALIIILILLLFLIR